MHRSNNIPDNDFSDQELMQIESTLDNVFCILLDNWLYSHNKVMRKSVICLKRRHNNWPFTTMIERKGYQTGLAGFKFMIIIVFLSCYWLCRYIISQDNLDAWNGYIKQVFWLHTCWTVTTVYKYSIKNQLQKGIITNILHEIYI